MSIESRKHQYGTVFGSWQIKELLGRGSGGKSAVFRLEHAGTPGVFSALKVISLMEEHGKLDEMTPARRADYENTRDQCSRQAEQEVLSMYALGGRTNIVNYMNHGFVDWSDEDGFGRDMLILMELLTDLRREINKGHDFSEEEALKVGRDICNALILCHGKNIIHRDIKPENIFVNSSGDYKLGDFGISKITVNSSPFASTGIGTPQYEAPEQLSGSYDKRVDIYSLGLVLYELMNGNRLPFASSVYIRQEETNLRLAGTPLPRPKNASDAFVQLILKACAYDPDARFQSAEAMAEALSRLSTGGSKQDYATVPASKAPAQGPYRTMPAAFSGPPVRPDPQRFTPPAAGNAKKSKPSGAKRFLVPLLLTVLALLAAGVVLFIKNRPNDTADDEPETEPAIAEAGVPDEQIPAEGPAEAVESAAASAPEETPETPAETPAPEETPKTPAETPAPEETPETPAKTPKPEKTPEAHTAAPFDPSTRLAAGGRHTVVIREDGTAIAFGDSSYGACLVSAWTDLKAVSAGDYFTLGLRQDGRVIACGDNQYGQCNVSGWDDVVAIAAGDFHSIGLRSDGSLLACGWNEDGQCNVALLQDSSGQRGITAIAAGFRHSVVLYSDGTVGAIGDNSSGQCNVSTWTDVTAVYAGVAYTLGLRSDGTVLAVGDNHDGQCNVGMWKNIAYLSTGDFFAIGVTNDGQVLGTGQNDDGQLNTYGWTDVAAVAAGCRHTVAVTADGTILAIGENKYGQCNAFYYNR